MAVPETEEQEFSNFIEADSDIDVKQMPEEE